MSGCSLSLIRLYAAFFRIRLEYFGFMLVRRHIIIVFVVILAALPAYAQRTMVGQSFIELDAKYPVGAKVSYGQYIIPAYWAAGVEAMRMRSYLRVDGDVSYTPLDVWQLKAQGDFMYRLVSTRGRTLSLYAGTGLWVGVEKVDPLGALPPDVIIDLNKDYVFVFGGTPRIEMEVFMGNHVALVLGGQLPCAVFSQIRIVTLQGTAGLRIAF